MMTLAAINKGFGKIEAQKYSWANGVSDVETGDVMDLKQILKHSIHTEAWTLAAAKNMDAYSKVAEKMKTVHNVL